MFLSGLRILYAELKKNDNTYCIFKFQKNKIDFDIFYDIAKNPFQLGFLVLKNDFQLWINIEKGFNLNPKLDPDDFFKLAKLLNLKPDINNKFSTKAFFEEFNEKIPRTIPQIDPKYVHHLIINTYNIEEKDKLYYNGSIEWEKTECKHKRRPENLEKTRLLYPELYIKIKDRNISIKYTDKNGN
jgi:hypothetical protein